MSFLLRTFAIARKEILQLRRDRLTGGMIVGIPTLQLLLFGYAINTDVRHLRAGVADMAGTQLSRSLIADAQASQVAKVVAQVETPEQLEELLRVGLISIGLVIPHDFDRRVTLGQTPAQLLVDASDPTILQSAQGLVDMPVPGRPGVARPVRPPTFELRAHYNPERRSEVQIVPSLIGVILTLTMSLFTAVAIVRERERGTLEFLINTPVRTVELMLGKILPYIVIGFVQVTLILVVGVLLFRVPIRGSLLDLYAGAGLFIAATLSVGLLISTVAKTQFQAFQLTIFFFMPSLLLSGFMFPFEGMPRPVQWLAEVFPLTHFLRIIRGIVLRDAALSLMWQDLWPLAVFFLVFLGIATLRFEKRLD